MKSRVALLPALVLLLGTASPVAAETTIEDAAWEAAEVTPAPPVRVPPLTLPDVSARPVSLADFKGHVVMLYFWATW
ncbi:MAG: peroxiredoxin family protein [Candidatus Rokuibacteriota bacterium]